METRHLEYFVAVAEELNFTRAATRTFAVQSTVSAAISALERDLGERLFDRSTKRVTLTAAGTALLPEARAAIEAIDRVRSSVAESTAGIRGRLRVGIFTNLAAIDLPQLFAEFRRRYPLVDVQLTASPSGSTGFVDDVNRGRVDVAFMGLPGHDLVGLELLEVVSTEFAAVLPTAHPLSTRSSVELAELASEPFVDTPDGFGNRVVLERVLAAEGISRTVTTVIADLGDVPRYVAAGLGIAVIPRALAALTDDTVMVPLARRIEWSLSLVSRRRPSPATSALLDLVRERG